MYSVQILPHAKNDIKNATHWYNEKQKGLGKRFTSKIKEKVHFIKQHPKASILKYKNVRTAIVDIFPFMIHYIIDEQKELITIIAVFHTSQNPKKWEKR